MYEYNPEGERGGGVATLQRPSPSVVYQGVPEGEFVAPYVEVIGHPDNVVPVGEEIRLRAHYQAHCPGQPWYAPAWTDRAVTFEVTLWGNPDAWQELPLEDP
jgi:hypothetical protein